MARGRGYSLDDEREAYDRRRYWHDETGSYADVESPGDRDYRPSGYERETRRSRDYPERDHERAREERGGRYDSSRSGPYAGRGPKGYRRSDERITEDICERMTEHGEIDARDVDVEVHDGEVTLRGAVENREMKRRSEAVAEAVPGVRDVVNELRVRETYSDRSPRGGWSRRPADRGAIRPGMMVIDSTGDRLGRVKEVRGDYFVIDRWLEPDISVDVKAISRVEDRVYIDADVPDRLTRAGDFPKH